MENTGLDQVDSSLDDASPIRDPPFLLTELSAQVSELFDGELVVVREAYGRGSLKSRTLLRRAPIAVRHGFWPMAWPGIARDGLRRMIRHRSLPRIEFHFLCYRPVPQILDRLARIGWR